MKRTVLVLVFCATSWFGFSQEKPCHLTEVEEAEGIVLKAEKNYVSSDDKELRLCLQFQFANDRLCLGVTIEGKRRMEIDTSNVAYVQLSSGEEHILRLASYKYGKDEKTLECRFEVAGEDERDFAMNMMTGVYLSTKEYPQIDISDLNPYTARKIRERFNCAYTNFLNGKL